MAVATDKSSSGKATRFLLSPWLALVTFGILLCVKIADPFLIEATRLKFYDYVMMDQPIHSDQIVVANIDEEAIEKYGQWPFARNVHGEIISGLYGRGAGLVGSTVLFSESDRQGGDDAFASTLSQYPVVLSQTASTNCRQDRNQNHQTRLTGVAVVGDGQATDFLPSYPCVLDNIPALQQAAAGVGITSTLPEADGVVRRIPLLAQSDGEYFPAFAIELLRTAAGDPSYQAKINQTGVEALRIPSFATINTDEYGRIFVNPNYVFDEINIGSSRELDVDLNQKIVILGVSAAGVQNPVATAQGAQNPQYLQASILQTLLDGVSISVPGWAGPLDFSLLIILTLGIVILSRVRYSVAWIMIMLAGYIYLPVYLFQTQSVLLDISFNILAALILYLHVYTVKFISEYLQKQQIKKQFGTYLSPAMVEKLQKNPELLALGGDSRELSIMFTDVRGFTTISEHYGKDVQGLTKIMNRYMTAMTKRIIEKEGTLDKYIGDAQMAFWNAPLDDKDHALHAVETGLAMLEDLEKFNEEIEREGVPAFGMGLGINTDTVVVGNMGSDQRFDYTCLGDGVNLASRLEGQTKGYGVKIIIGPKTADQVRHAYQVVELDLIAVKGKTEPVKIYTVLEAYDVIGEIQHGKFLDLYRMGHFDVAKRFAIELKGSWRGELDEYYSMMIDRIDSLKKTKPKDWDGVYRATSK
jgi:adenylate cyclase